MPSFRKVKSNNWLESENQFGDFSSVKEGDDGGGGHESKRPVGGAGKKRPRENNNSLSKAPGKSFSAADIDNVDATSSPLTKRNMSSSELWISRHQPASVDDLAVNKKKVEEVRSWVSSSVSGSGGILLLTGPAGAGKTATLTMLARNMKLEVREWVNPVEQVHFNTNNLSMLDEEETRHYDYNRDVVTYTSKSRQFEDWLRGAKYSCVGVMKKIILLEDLPSGKPEKLHEILESFAESRSKIPLVIIISESATAKESGSVKQLFPPAVVERLKIHVINFNPVTNTNMVKTMTKIAVIESGLRKFQVPDKPTLELLAESVAGDLRAGINSLQFSCLNDTRDLKTAFEGVSKIASSKSSNSKNKKQSSMKSVSQLSKIGGKDHGLVMFHALGKILYNKREDQTESGVLPAHLEDNRRRLMKSNPDEVVEKSTLSADAFTCFLHHNYPPFYTQLEDVARLSEYLSTSDMFLSEWSHGGKISLTEYGGMISARSVMFCNTGAPANLGMRTLNKPEHYSVVRTVRQKQYELQNIFFTQQHRELITSTLPLLTRIRPAHIPGHKMITVTDIGTFPGIKQTRVRPQAAIEQDDVFDEADETLAEAVTNNDQEKAADNNVIDEDEELVIEDFDDDD